MPSIFQSIAVFLASIVSPITARVLGALGIGVITLTGVQAGITTLIDLVKDRVGGVAADLLNIMTLAGFDVFISIIISAYAGIISLQALWGGFKRLGFAASDSGGS